MARVITEMKLSEEVLPQVEVCLEYVPAVGSFVVEKFHGDAAYNLNCAVKLIWDPTGENKVIWTHKGSGQMPFIEDSLIGDGVKKIALCLDNALTTGGVFMSGYAKIVQEI